MMADYGLPAEKVTAIGGGVNFSSLPELGETPAKKQPIILFIGKDFYRKGGDILLQAFDQVRERIPQAQLWLVTEGPAPRAEGQQGVRVIDPTWNRQVIHQLYSQASLFVLPSRLETWGDVLLEAMAYQLPCVGVRGDAMEEIILDGITGLVVPPDDPQALEEAIVRLLSEPSIRCTMGQAGRRRVEQNFLWARVIDRLEPIIQQIFRCESQ
jgi:glycosyltransferase involved in cell wall biosynthesis